MLILTRRQGESLIIGDNIKITVLIIYKTQIKLEINDSEVITIRLQENISIKDDIILTIANITKSQVKLGIQSPKRIKIKKYKLTKYITNHTTLLILLFYDFSKKLIFVRF